MPMVPAGSSRLRKVLSLYIVWARSLDGGMVVELSGSSGMVLRTIKYSITRFNKGGTV